MPYCTNTYFRLILNEGWPLLPPFEEEKIPEDIRREMWGVLINETLREVFYIGNDYVKILLIIYYVKIEKNTI